MTEYEDQGLREFVDALMDARDDLENLAESVRLSIAALDPLLRTYGWKPPEEVKHESDS